MRWSWHDLQATPVPVVEQILELMEAEADRADDLRREIDGLRRR